jgi:hypothetical protein
MSKATVQVDFMFSLSEDQVFMQVDKEEWELMSEHERANEIQNELLNHVEWFYDLVE